MQLGDEATGKLGGITREFDSSSEKLRRHGEALDRAAESARNDIAVLLEDLPQRRTNRARRSPSSFALIGSESTEKAASFGQQVSDLAERTRERRPADRRGDRAPRRTAGRDRSAGSVSRGSAVGEAETGLFRARSTPCSSEHRKASSKSGPGIDVQAAAVAALVAQASAGIGKAGADAAESLAANLDHANTLARRRCRAGSPSRTAPRSG